MESNDKSSETVCGLILELMELHPHIHEIDWATGGLAAYVQIMSLSKVPYEKMRECIDHSIKNCEAYYRMRAESENKK